MTWFKYIGFNYEAGVLLSGYEYPENGLLVEADTQPENYEPVTDINYLTYLRGKHYIETLVDTKTNKDYRNLIDSVDLRSGVSINYQYDFNNDGTFSKVTALHGLNKVYEITFTYEYNQEDIDDNRPISLVGVNKKVEKTLYYFEDGQTIDDFDDVEGRTLEDRLTSKEIEFTYPNLYSQLQFGAKKREQLQIIATEKLAISTILLGIYSNNNQARKLAQRLSNKYDRQFNQYRDRATDTIFNKIETDDANNIGVILDNIFPDLATIDLMPEPQRTQIQGAIQLYGLQDVVGKTLRAYVLGKLKGELA